MNTMTRQVCFFLALMAIPTTAWFVLFKPQDRDIQDALTEIARKQQEITRVAELVRGIPALEASLVEGREMVESIEAQLPRRRDVESVLERIWQIAERNGLSVRSVKTQAPVSSMIYMELPLEVSMVGPFEGFYHFLQDLESMPRITRMPTLALQEYGMEVRTNGDAADAPGWVAADFILSIHFADAMGDLADATGGTDQ